MPQYPDDFLYSDSRAAPPASPLLIPPQPGIGLGPSSQVDLRNQAIARMSTSEKIGSALGDFGAALQGRELPLDKRIAQQRQERGQKLNELRIFSDVTTRAFEEADKLTGDARDQYIKMQMDQLNAVSPGSGDILKSLIDDPGYGKLVLKNAEKSPTLRTALEIGGLRKARDLMKSVEGAKLIKGEIEAAELPTIRSKLQTLGLAAQKLMTPERYQQMQADGFISPNEVAEINQVALQHPEYKAAALSPEQLELASRYEDATYGMSGLATSKTAQETLKKGPESTVGKIKADLKAGRITQKEADEAIAKSGGVTINMPGSTGMGINPATGKPGHYSIGKDGTVRWDPVQPLPKEVDPVRKAIADAIAAAGQDQPAPKPAAKPKYKIGDTLTRAGKTWKITGFDKDGEPLVEEAKKVKK